MGVNFFGVGHTLRHFVPKMMDQEAPGAIVTTASLTGIRVGAGLCATPLSLVAQPGRSGAESHTLTCLRKRLKAWGSDFVGFVQMGSRSTQLWR